MFVLCFQMQTLDLRHLIHKEDGERHDEVQRDMYVKLLVQDLTHDK